jgi:hypothetical protein
VWELVGDGGRGGLRGSSGPVVGADRGGQSGEATEAGVSGLGRRHREEEEKKSKKMVVRVSHGPQTDTCVRCLLLAPQQAVSRRTRTATAVYRNY